jgi:DNA polymerase III epsilon subunit-like protein
MGIVLDTETTGVRARSHSVIEVAAVAVDEDGRETGSFQTLANPGEAAIRAADPGAMAVNRITAAMLRAAPPINEAADALELFLARHAGLRLHSFNEPFDRGFLVMPPWMLAGEWGGCLMRAAMGAMGRAGALRRRRGGGWKFPTLSEAAGFFGVRNHEEHRALGDARTAAAIRLALAASAAPQPAGSPA